MKNYNEIQGWCDFEWLYSDLANRYNCGKIAEVGVWKGRSLVYLASQMFSRGYETGCIFAIDTWAGSLDEAEHQDYIKSIGGPDALYNEFLQNIDGYSNIIPLRGKSTDIAKLFPDKFFDVVFIDAAHDYENFKADVLAWLPKVKHEIYGHDADWPPIQKALNEIWPNQWKKQGSCWKGIV